jgi:hypothetical protein
VNKLINLLGSINGGRFLDQMSVFLLFKKDPSMELVKQVFFVLPSAICKRKD